MVELRRWSGTAGDHLEDLLFLAPWLALPTPGARTSDPNGQNVRAPDLSGPGSLNSIRCRLAPGVPNWPSRSARFSKRRLDRWPRHPRLPEQEDGVAQWLGCFRQASARAGERILALEDLARQSTELAEMDFSFLFDPARELFSIGFNVTERRSDPSFYDLLASEARLCSYVVIARGQVSQDHWFSLGRLLVASAATRYWPRGAGRCSSI